jgi:cytidylate kinase
MMPDNEKPATDTRHPTPFQIAIDGPAGAGKSTVARGVARALGFVYIDTGAMYRAIALKVCRMTGPDADPDWGAVAEETALRFRTSPSGQRIEMDGEDVEEAIRTPQISDRSSRVSADTRVRQALTCQMKRMAESQDVVMEGRDIGSVVLPEARLKIFLTAPEEERARRRAEELKARGKVVRLEDVLADMRERDARDANRDAAPLIKAPDAVEVDTGGMTVEEVIDAIVRLARARLPEV